MTNIVNLENRRKRKAFEANIGKNKSASEYVKGKFVIKEIREGGQVVLEKDNKEYKILMEYPDYKKYVEGEIIRGMLSKKVFYVYWELAYTY